MIELAPGHKTGLSLPGCLMPAAGCFGFGPEYSDLVDVALFGAVVTNAVSLRPQRGPSQPRVVELNDGCILNIGDQNPGVRQVIRRSAGVWRRLGRPVIVHLAAAAPADVARVARALADTGAVAGLEVGLPDESSTAEAGALVRAAGESELPVLARLPLFRATALAATCVQAGADSLVVAAPPVAAAPPHASGQLVTGRLYARSVHALVLPVLRQVRDLVAVPLVGSGGIHNTADVHAMRAAGAVAVQVDGVLLRAPWLLTELASNSAPET